MNHRNRDEVSETKTKYRNLEEVSDLFPSDRSSIPPPGQHLPLDNTLRTRHTLPPTVASALLEAHRQTGASYRAVARAVGTDVAHYWRLTRGTRAPSRTLAFRLIDVLWLNNEVAQELLEASVDRTSTFGQ
jgi:hypothetical protein